jgi:hypothetical protein
MGESPEVGYIRLMTRIGTPVPRARDQSKKIADQSGDEPLPPSAGLPGRELKKDRGGS